MSELKKSKKKKCLSPGSNWGPLVCETNVITNYTTQTMWWAVVFLFICSLCVVCTSDGYLIILRPNSSSSFACVNLHKTVSDSQRSVVPLSMSYVNNSSLFFRVLFRAEPQSFNNWIKRRLHPCRWHTTCLLTMKVQKPPEPTTHNQNAEKQQIELSQSSQTEYISAPRQSSGHQWVSLFWQGRPE